MTVHETARKVGGRGGRYRLHKVRDVYDTMYPVDEHLRQRNPAVIAATERVTV